MDGGAFTFKPVVRISGVFLLAGRSGFKLWFDHDLFSRSYTNKGSEKKLSLRGDQFMVMIISRILP